MYKRQAQIAFKPADTCLVTVREAAFEAPEPAAAGTVEKIASPLKEDLDYRKFVEYIEAVVGDVDITQSEILVGIGRGLKEDKNLPVAEELAKLIKADLCGSRAACDAGWLPTDRQVGTSGKTVKPKLYLCMGISGAFQHLSLIHILRDALESTFREGNPWEKPRATRGDWMEGLNVKIAQPDQAVENLFYVCCTICLLYTSRCV